MNTQRWMMVMLGAALASCTSVPPKPTKQLDSKVTLLYQSNREATLEPCGCTTKPWGGMDREFNAVTAIRGQGREVLFVDSGNMLAPLTKSPLSLAQKQEKAKAVLAMVNKLGVEVFAPGSADYSLGVDFLKTLATPESKIAFVSSNVVTKADGKPVFAPIVYLDKAGVKYAFISATPKEAITDPALEVLDPESTVKKRTEEALQTADVVVLLSQLGSAVDEKMAQKEIGYHIVAGADTQFAFDDGLVQNKGKVLQVDQHLFGYQLGKVELDLKLPFTGFYSPKKVTANQAELKRLEAELADKTKAADAQKRIDLLKNKGQLAEIPGGTAFRNELIPLTKEKYGKKNEVTKMLDAEKKRVRAAAIKEAK